MPDPFPKKHQETEPLNCQCGHLIGYSYFVDNVLVGVQCGGLMISEGSHGRCASCGRGVHITIPLKSLRKLLSNYGATIESVTVEFTEAQHENE